MSLLGPWAQTLSALPEQPGDGKETGGCSTFLSSVQFVQFWRVVKSHQLNWTHVAACSGALQTQLAAVTGWELCLPLCVRPV